MNNEKLGFKGFDQNFSCRNFKYKVGETYTGKDISICNKGFHFCINPFDVFNYYPPTSRFGMVKGNNVVTVKDKSVCANITIVAGLSLQELIKNGIEYILKGVNFKDNCIHNTGYKSAASNTGNYSAASISGKESIAIVTGYKSKAKGKLGCWLVLTERDENYIILNVLAIKVDNKEILEDTFYTLIDGKTIKADNN